MNIHALIITIRIILLFTYLELLLLPLPPLLLLLLLLLPYSSKGLDCYNSVLKTLTKWGAEEEEESEGL